MPTPRPLQGVHEFMYSRASSEQTTCVSVPSCAPGRCYLVDSTTLGHYTQISTLYVAGTKGDEILAIDCDHTTPLHAGFRQWCTYNLLAWQVVDQQVVIVAEWSNTHVFRSCRVSAVKKPVVTYCIWVKIHRYRLNY